MIKAIVTDIEGTTTPIDFVKNILFPFSARYLEDYVMARLDKNDMQKLLMQVSQTAKEELGMSLDSKAAIQLLLRWIEEDRKHPALKTIQGQMWHEGYASGVFKGEVYDDVPKALQQWKDQGIILSIYSSGSVAAQKDLFKHTAFGDLSVYFKFFFDTAIGGKKEMQSYQRIAQELKLDAGEILFLSDIEAELDAAKETGMRTFQLLRPGTRATQRHATVATFAEISF